MKRVALNVLVMPYSLGWTAASSPSPLGRVQEED
jgi:hypothetical protein